MPTTVTKTLVCLRCERKFPELSIEAPPEECPNCGKDVYWAIQMVTAGLGNFVGIDPVQCPQ